MSRFATCLRATSPSMIQMAGFVAACSAFGGCGGSATSSSPVPGPASPSPTPTSNAGQITEYAIPTANSLPIGITSGPDGALWFAEYAAGKIGRITTAGRITEYRIKTGGNPRWIVSGSDGALWFTEASAIGRITTRGQVSDFPLPSSSVRPAGIAAGSDGACSSLAAAIRAP